jgi:hypothetical protein
LLISSSPSMGSDFNVLIIPHIEVRKSIMSIDF